MTELPLYQIDAFADRLFAGNPAAVVPLERWLPDATMRAIAAENNLSETAFFVPSAEHWQLRWFTPAVEIDLCGHATLASASVIMETLDPARTEVSFTTRSGLLRVTRAGEGAAREYTLDFPADPPERAAVPPGMAEALGVPVLEFWTARRNLALVESEAALAAARAEFGRPDWLAERNLVVTAPARAGSQYDFVSRFFAPLSGVTEDPVTGSAHCTLAPFWAARLGRTEFNAWQASARGGALRVRLAGGRVYITGRCVRYLEGRILLPA